MSDPVVVTGLPVLEPLPAPLELKVEPVPAQRPRLAISDSGEAAGQDDLALRSAAALVLSQEDGQLLYAKNTDAVMPIASITKLMTAMVILDSGLSLDEPVTITREDVDKLKGTKSRLRLGLTLPRREMLRLALMASENRAAATLARGYPGGTDAFVQAMNLKARQLGMRDTRFVDATGLNPNNVSTALDLAVLVNAGYHYPLIRDYSTTDSVRLAFRGGRKTRALAFRNSNALVRNGQWEIGLQKTGYISEAGRCLVMQARISARPVIIVLLDSWGRFTRVADANRIKRWVETLEIGAPRKARMM
jgi:D-alanyl-D-alanine endopeptidase (penicillin-binding protein 7)